MTLRRKAKTQPAPVSAQPKEAISWLEKKYPMVYWLHRPMRKGFVFLIPMLLLVLAYVHYFGQMRPLPKTAPTPTPNVTVYTAKAGKGTPNAILDESGRLATVGANETRRVNSPELNATQKWVRNQMVEPTRHVPQLAYFVGTLLLAGAMIYLAINSSNDAMRSKWKLIPFALFGAYAVLVNLPAIDLGEHAMTAAVGSARNSLERHFPQADATLNTEPSALVHFGFGLGSSASGRKLESELNSGQAITDEERQQSLSEHGNRFINWTVPIGALLTAGSMAAVALPMSKVIAAAQSFIALFPFVLLAALAMSWWSRRWIRLAFKSALVAGTIQLAASLLLVTGTGLIMVLHDVIAGLNGIGMQGLVWIVTPVAALAIASLVLAAEAFVGFAAYNWLRRRLSKADNAIGKGSLIKLRAREMASV